MKTIKITDILSKLWCDNEFGLEEAFPDGESVCAKIRDLTITLKVAGNDAIKLLEKGLAREIENQVYEDDEFVEVEVAVDDFGFETRENYFCCFYVKDYFPQMPCEATKEEIEIFINDSIQAIIDLHNCLTVCDSLNGGEIYLELPDYEYVTLDSLDSSWTDEQFILDGENPYEDKIWANSIKGDYD